MNIVLYQPEIPPNTGNIIRLCANTSSELHIIKPMGFDLNAKSCRRAGLDYHSLTFVHIYESWGSFTDSHKQIRLVGLTTKATEFYHDYTYKSDDFLLFGPETRGLPDTLLSQTAIKKIRVPMAPCSRSLNLSNTVAIVLYESLRQQNFQSLKTLLQ